MSMAAVIASESDTETRTRLTSHFWVVVKSHNPTFSSYRWMIMCNDPEAREPAEAPASPAESQDDCEACHGSGVVIARDSEGERMPQPCPVCLAKLARAQQDEEIKRNKAQAQV